METSWIIAIISLVVTTAITTTVGILIKKAFDKHDKKQEELMSLRDARARDERNEDIKNIVKEEISPLSEQITSLSNDVSKIGNGTLSTLRNDILTCYYRCHEKGYRNDYDFTNIHDLYEAYERLNGNSFIGDVMERFDNLPTKEEYRKEQEKKAKAEKKKKESN